MPLVLVDKERIEHVFDNLMTNALRHTERGGTIILRAAAAEGTVQFSVEDTGEGIRAQFSPGVRQVFSDSGAKHQGGAGLGLAIVHEIIVSHGGQIGVQSTIGKGTTFTFSLPAAAVSQDEAATGRLDLVSTSSTR